MQQDLIPHLFRTEAGKITTVLCRQFGMEHLQLAEDITSDTFLRAMETWPYNGIPQNPAAWLYTVAKNKAINHFNRNKIYIKKILPELLHAENAAEDPGFDFSIKNISDSQLQMLFAVCDPVIPPESQVALALRILCGFGIEEIANAFLTSKEVIYKRIFRAKDKLKEYNIQLDSSFATDINDRLQNVLQTLYLLFNEGYYSETNESVLREDLCFEAMRLLNLLIENPETSNAAANALMALMCFHASRFPSRRDQQGNMVLYADQDESLWNQELISKGVFFFQQSSGGELLSKYHLEAGIAYWHTIKNDSREKWENILQLYNRLLVINYSPVAALNRTYALFKTRGTTEAIQEAEKLQLTSNHYYYLLLGELYKQINPETSAVYLQRAIELAKTEADKLSIAQRIGDGLI